MLNLISILFALVFSDGNNFDSQLKKYLDEKLIAYVKYEYQVTQMPKNYAGIEINDEKNFRLNKNYAYVPIKVYDQNNMVSTSLLTVKLKLYKNVFLTVRDIPKNEKLTANSVITKIEDVSLFNGKLVDVQKDLQYYKSKIIIKEGTILSENMIEAIPIINKGDHVILHTIGSGVDVSVEVIARQDGHIGDIISVYVPASKLYKGKIIDKKNLALVD